MINYLTPQDCFKSYPGKIEMHNHKENTIMYMVEDPTPTGIPNLKNYYWVVEKIIDGKRKELYIGGYPDDTAIALATFMDGCIPGWAEEAEKMIQQGERVRAARDQERRDHEAHHKNSRRQNW